MGELKPNIHNRSTAEGPKKLLLIGMPCWSVAYPFHALAQVAGIAQKAGWDCHIADLNIKIFRAAAPADQKYWTDDDLAPAWSDEQLTAPLYQRYQTIINQYLGESVTQSHYDVIGFSVNTYTRYFSLQAAQYIKSLKPEVPIIFGGVDCFPKEYGKQFFEQQKHLPDIMLQGEAEIALIEFLKAFTTPNNYPVHVKGFVFRNQQDLIDTGEPELPTLKDENIQADFSQFDFSLYTSPGDFPIFMSRGCINRCAFCSESPNFKRFRYRKAEHVFQEIKATLKYAARYSSRPTIHFSDSLLNGNVAALEKLCDFIIEAGIQVDWGGQSYFRKEMTRAFLEKMYKAGAKGFFWGFESGSQHVINLMRKNYNLDIAERIITEANAIGISNWMPIIVGFPGETPLDFLLTVTFVLKHKDRKHVFFNMPSGCLVRPNSELHQRYADFGLANNEYTVWHTEDHRNTIAVRFFRRFVLVNVIRNPSLSFETMVHADLIEQIDFNDFSVASEIAAILYDLAKRSGTAAEQKTFFEQWQGAVLQDMSPQDLSYWYPENTPKDIDLLSWFKNNKNSDSGRNSILRRLFELLRSYQALIIEAAIQQEQAAAPKHLSVSDRLSMTSPLSYSTQFNLEKLNDRIIEQEQQPLILTGDEFTVTGWAVDAPRKKAAGDVYIDIDGQLFPTSYGLSRPDVASYFHVPAYSASGFETKIHVSDIGKGPHTLSLKILTHDREAYYASEYHVAFEIQ